MTGTSEISDNIPGDNVIAKKGKGELTSGTFHRAEVMREKLNRVSPCMCLAKWLQVSIHLTTGQTQSCYHPPTHKIPLHEIQQNPSALHNTQFKKEQRHLMLKGERPKECEYCWNIEDASGDHLSDRHYRSGEDWAMDHFDEVLNTGHRGDINPRYVEINFNHACQLKCSYCSPHLSSSWWDEIRKFGPYPTMTPHNDIEWIKKEGLAPIRQNEPNPYREAFWEWWPSLYKDLRVFRMTGGEPLMDPNTFRVLDYIIEHPSPELQVAITSNMCPRPELMDKFLEKAKVVADGKKVDHLALFASLDSWGKQAEYIRFGLNFDFFLDNIKRYLSTINSGSITFINTFNVLSLHGLQKMVEGILDLREEYSQHFQKVWFDTPMLRYPAWQSVQILPPNYQGPLEDTIAFMKTKLETRETRLKGIKDFEVAKLERVLAWMKQTPPQEKLERDRADFYLFFSEHDRRRGTEFLKVFPEMADFWDLCFKAWKKISQG